MDTPVSHRVTAAARLDRLPITAFHRHILWLLGFCFFFELGDINTFAFAAPAIRMQWGISITQISYITGATFFGMFAGATLGGRFSDMVGRKRALIVTMLWFSAASLLNAVAWEPIGLFVARLLTGVGLSAMTAVGITYVAEMFPANKRGTYQGWVLFIGLVGIPAAAFVAYLVVPVASWGWRLIFIWGSLGAIFPLLAAKLEESPRWYEKRGRFAEADAALDRIEASVMRETKTLPPVETRAHVTPKEGHFRELFETGARGRTAMFVVVWIFQTLGFYGFSAWVPTLLVEQGFELVEALGWATMMQFGGLLGASIAASLSDRWERKYWLTIAPVLIATCGVLYGLTFNGLLIGIFGFLVIMFIQCFAPMLYAYTGECFPTELRSSGTGFTYGIGRLSNAFSPMFIPFLYNSYGYLSVFVYIATCWLVVSLTIGLFGPRTRGRQL
jgi:putative MFS transporter